MRKRNQEKPKPLKRIQDIVKEQEEELDIVDEETDPVAETPESQSQEEYEELSADPEDLETEFEDYLKEYEEDGTEEAGAIVSVKERNIPNITLWRSRFSNGQAELERLAELNSMISKYSIQISARTQDLSKLWTFYGILDEFWDIMRVIHGKTILNEIDLIREDCENTLEKLPKGRISIKVHKKLLGFKRHLYIAKQMTNLGFEVESSGGRSRLHQQIVE